MNERGIGTEAETLGLFEAALVAFVVALAEVDERILIAAAVVFKHCVAAVVSVLETVNRELMIECLFGRFLGADNAGDEGRDFDFVGVEAHIAEVEGQVIFGAVFGQQGIEVGPEFLTGDFVERLHDVVVFSFGVRQILTNYSAAVNKKMMKN